jgi:hypothetical protein
VRAWVAVMMGDDAVGVVVPDCERGTCGVDCVCGRGGLVVVVVVSLCGGAWVLVCVCGWDAWDARGSWMMDFLRTDFLREGRWP